LPYQQHIINTVIIERFIAQNTKKNFGGFTHETILVDKILATAPKHEIPKGIISLVKILGG